MEEPETVYAAACRILLEVADCYDVEDITEIDGEKFRRDLIKAACREFKREMALQIVLCCGGLLQISGTKILRLPTEAQRAIYKGMGPIYHATTVTMEECCAHFDRQHTN